ncbi:MAG: MBL fold metallo-hydrolase [Pseudomonadota bacterium]
MNRRSFLKYAGFTGLAVATGFGGTIAVARSRNPYYDGPVSDHFDGLSFFNPQGEAPKGFVELMKWQLGGGRKAWPSTYPSPFQGKPKARVTGGELEATYVGHATVLVQVDGLNILTDPVWSDRCSPVTWAGPKRVNPPGIAMDDLPPIDVVLISHNHYDHLDLETLDQLHTRFKPLIVCPLGNDKILSSHNAGYKIAVGDWGDRIDLSPTTAVTLEPMHHWSARGLGDRRNALWAAFAIQTPAGLIYHVGDTGFFGGRNYEAFFAKHGAPRLAILPFGAYEPRDFMRAQHQNPDEAVRGHGLCKAAFTLGHHWGTFQLTNESIEDQLADLDAARKKHGVGEDVFRALQPGQSWSVPQQPSVAT